MNFLLKSKQRMKQLMYLYNSSNMIKTMKLKLQNFIDNKVQQLHIITGLKQRKQIFLLDFLKNDCLNNLLKPKIIKFKIILIFKKL